MSTTMQTWLSSVLAGLILVGVGAVDAFVNHAALAGSTGDVSLIYVGASAILGRAIYELGVQVPNPPKA